MQWRLAGPDDAPLLARMNAELIQDEGHSNSMTVAELETRMRGWLSADHWAVVFEDEEVGAPAAYALYRDNEGRGVLLRQFFVARDRRRRGVGRRAFAALVTEVLPAGTRVVVEVLSHNTRAIAFWQAVGFADYARTLERHPTSP